MMFVSMRIQKSQVPDLLRFTTPGTTNIARSDILVRLAAGYVSMDVMVVGGSGGYASDILPSGRTDKLYSNGPGGGGSARQIFPIKSFITSTVYPALVGTGGGVVPPARTSYGSVPKGVDGGESSFAQCVAPGGKGAAAMTLASNGSATTGAASEGGLGKNSVISGGTQSAGASTLGTWRYGPSEPQGGGRGGDGGLGKKIIGGSTTGFNTPGTYGAFSSDNRHTSAPSPAPANAGGSGGGCSVKELTGVQEYYGVNPLTPIAGHNRQGCVIIKFI